MRTQSNYYENKVLGDLQTIIRTLRCESGGSGNCCPETNEILVNIKSNLDSVLETCVSETNQSNQLIVRPTSAQDSDLYGELSDYITVRRSNNAFLNMEIGRTIL